MRINRQPGKASSVRLAVLCALLATQPIAAWAEPAGIRYQVNQPSQPLSDALKAIARQTHSSVLFDPGTVGKRVSQPVAGQFSGAEAISRALEGTGLTAEVMKDGSIVVKPEAELGPAQVGPARGVRSSDESAAVVAAGPTRASPIQFAQAQPPVPGAADAGAGGSAAGREVEQQQQRIEVTGSRIKRVELEGPLPVNIYTREDIDKSGQPTLGGFLSNLNEVSVISGEGSLGGKAGQATVQLRGLPLGTTLVLLNGRRMQAGGATSANYLDLNLIPFAAIERIEVLPVGSSAVYGGDALAGVVNIILKKSIDGHALDVRIASAKGTGDGGLSFATGGAVDRGSFLLLGSLRKSTPLTMAERSFFLDADYRRFGGPDARTRDCTPGTVSSNTAANLPGLNSTFAAIPVAASGQPLTVAHFAATAGQASLCNSFANGSGLALVQGSEAVALHAAADYRIGDAWSIFGELTHTDERLRTQERGLRLNNVLVSADNPYNPFGVAVRINSRLGTQNGAQGVERNTESTRALLGLRSEFAAGWDLEATASTSLDAGDSLILNGTVNAAARTAALASGDPTTALNPFTTGRAASEEVLRGIWADTPRTFEGKKDLVTAFVRGTAFGLPAGSVDVIAGLEWSRDGYKTATPGDFAFDVSRRSNAVFGEVRVPLMSGAESGRGFNLAALTIAGRRDDYSDFGSANTYQAGLEVRPSRSVLLRAGMATSFKPPTLLQTNVGDTRFSTEDFGLVDPTRGNTLIVGGEVVRGTNPNLQPETGKAHSLGAVWEPEGAPGLRLSVSAWQVKINKLISLLWAQETINNEALFPGIVTRGPSVGGVPGPITQVLYTELNVGSVDVAGVDFGAAHSWRTSAGKLHVSASATRTNKYDVVLAPGAPTSDRLGRRFFDFWAPKWKGRLATDLDVGPWSLGVTGRYVGGYKDSGTSTRNLGNSWTYDLSSRLDLKQFASGIGTVAKTASLSFGIVNVGNRQPEFVDESPYYDGTQADWRGRYASVWLSVGW